MENVLAAMMSSHQENEDEHQHNDFWSSKEPISALHAVALRLRGHHKADFSSSTGGTESRKKDNNSKPSNITKRYHGNNTDRNEFSRGKEKNIRVDKKSMAELWRALQVKWRDEERFGGTATKESFVVDESLRELDFLVKQRKKRWLQSQRENQNYFSKRAEKSSNLNEERQRLLFELKRAEETFGSSALQSALHELGKDEETTIGLSIGRERAKDEAASEVRTTRELLEECVSCATQGEATLAAIAGWLRATADRLKANSSQISSKKTRQQLLQSVSQQLRTQAEMLRVRSGPKRAGTSSSTPLKRAEKLVERCIALAKLEKANLKNANFDGEDGQLNLKLTPRTEEAVIAAQQLGIVTMDARQRKKQRRPVSAMSKTSKRKINVRLSTSTVRSQNNASRTVLNRDGETVPSSFFPKTKFQRKRPSTAVPSRRVRRNMYGNGNMRPEPAGKVRPKTAGKVRPKPTGKVRPKPAGIIRPKTAGSVRPKQTKSKKQIMIEKRREEIEEKLKQKEIHLKKIQANKRRIREEQLEKKNEAAQRRKQRRENAELIEKQRLEKLRNNWKKREEKLSKVSEEKFLKEERRKEELKKKIIERHKREEEQYANRDTGPGFLMLKDHIPSGGKFNLSKPLSDIEWQMKRASEIPAPGSYNLPKFGSNIKGGTWGTHQSLSDIEWKIKRSAEIPAPGSYTLPSTLNVAGGTWGTQNAKTDIAILCAAKAKIPGPGEYGCVDSDFSRYKNPFEREKYKVKVKKTKSPQHKKKIFLNFLKRQQAALPFKAYNFETKSEKKNDNNGKIWEHRRAAAKKQAEDTRQTLLKKAKSKQDRMKRMEAVRKKKREEKRRMMKERKNATEKRCMEVKSRNEKNRKELVRKADEKMRRVMEVQSKLWEKKKKLQNDRRLRIIERHKWHANNPPKPSPGPGQYTLPEFGAGIKGGTWGKTVSKSDIEWKMLRAAETPGPGQYALPEFGSGIQGGSWSRHQSKSDIEWQIKRASEIPGPSEYTLPSTLIVPGGRFSNAKPLSEVEMMILEAKSKPGPGQYQVMSEFDERGSPEVLRRFEKTSCMNK